MSNKNQSVEYSLFESGRWEKQVAEIITETPIMLTVNGEVWLSFMCTPVDLEALAIGFLYNEGFVEKIEEIASVRVCPTGENVDVWLQKKVEKPDDWRRTSGCTGGITSVKNNDSEVISPRTRINDGVVLSPNQIGTLIERLSEAQELYTRSGGVHTSALSDGQGIFIVCEDIGRHNTLDKIAGRCLLDQIELPQRILLTTGRISSEMIQKASRINASIVISRTSPSSLSIQMAERWGITLIGYARRNRFRLYTHPERIRTGEEDISSKERISSRIYPTL